LLEKKKTTSKKKTPNNQITPKRQLCQHSKNWENIMGNQHKNFQWSKLEVEFLKLNASKYHSQGLFAPLPLIFHPFSHEPFHSKLFSNSAIAFKHAQIDPRLLYFARKPCTWQISTILPGAVWEQPH